MLERKEKNTLLDLIPINVRVRVDGKICVGVVVGRKLRFPIVLVDNQAYEFSWEAIKKINQGEGILEV